MGTNLTPGLQKLEDDLKKFAARIKDKVVGDMAEELSTVCSNEVKKDFTEFFVMSPTYRDERRKEVIRSGATKAGVEPVVHDKYTFGVRSTAPGARIHEKGGTITASRAKYLKWVNPPERGGGWRSARSVKIKAKHWMSNPMEKAITRYMENDLKAKIDRPL